jgi:hypothetical protein
MAGLRSALFHALKAMDAVASHLPRVGNFQPLKGSFSAYERLQQGLFEGGVLVESQPIGPCPPGSITERCGMRQHDHQPWPVFWTRADDARLCGNLLRWRDPSNRICVEGCFQYPYRRRLGVDRLFAQLIVPQAHMLEGAWTSLVSHWGDGRNYFHWITDCLTRLRIRELLPEPTRILVPDSTAPYVRESLEMLGLADVCEMRKEPCLQPERFYFCSPLAMTGVWNPLGFDWLRENFRPFFRPAASGKPIFLTRRASTRIPEQLSEIEAMFAAAGYEILDCGKLGFREQIEAASGATAIAGIHGAAMTNIIWAHQGTPVLELFQAQYLNACYEQIAFQGQLDYTHLVLEGETPLRAIEEWLDCQR